MTNTVIVYGNCQAEALALVLQQANTRPDELDIKYLRSFEHPLEAEVAISLEAVAACRILLEQHDPKPFPYAELLPNDYCSVSFPATDLSLLWPFTCPNPLDRPELPAFPFGRFPYGDRIIIGCIEKGMQPEEAVAYYLEQWDEFAPDLSRLEALEQVRVASRDAHCDVKLADFVIGNFRSQHLFWSVNHPTMLTLAELTRRVLAECLKATPLLADLLIDATIWGRFAPEGPLGVESVPVHPRVAEHFKLSWYDPEALHQSWGGLRYTAREYFEAMARHAYLAYRSSTHPTGDAALIVTDGAVFS